MQFQGAMFSMREAKISGIGQSEEVRSSKGYLEVESSEWAGTYECGVCGQAGWPSIGQGTKQTSWSTLSLRLCDVMGRLVLMLGLRNLPFGCSLYAILV